MIAEIIAFIVLCFITVWSLVRGYQRSKKSRWISAVFFAFVGAYMASLIVIKLGEWL